MSKVKVYYNSACPVCDAGIKDQRRRMESCSAQVEWIDIDENPDVVKDIDAEQESVRERLHVVDQEGITKIGADAFAVLWAETPRQKWLARLVRFPVLSILSRLLYNSFAAGLYAWNRMKKRWVVDKKE
ncbi:thiol-disulfide oxidoreductase DCC family protein [Aquirhabdus parva]|uniref:DUF393 domain-containing protein n=1 Tax=Aquirhabdus parva TaxID=2283318 RepID=A0A345P778_9GAMM|nr:DUF393 domain-containing protein [Aquirhabdus parva]AXI03137.1 DUF393 domain-containing protein [Aquirhabdus parva]